MAIPSFTSSMSLQPASAYKSEITPVPVAPADKLILLDEILNAKLQDPRMVVIRAVGAYGSILGYEVARMNRDYLGHRDAPSTVIHSDLVSVKPAGNVGVVLATFKTNIQIEEASRCMAIFESNATTEIIKTTKDDMRSHTPVRVVRYKDESAKRFDSINELFKHLATSPHERHNEISLKYERARDLLAFFISDPQDVQQLLLLFLNRELHALYGTTQIPLVHLIKADSKSPIVFKRLLNLESLTFDEILFKTIIDQSSSTPSLDKLLLERTLLSMVGGVTDQNELTYLAVEGYQIRKKHLDLLQNTVFGLKARAPQLISEIDAISLAVAQKIQAKLVVRICDLTIGRKTKYSAQFIEMMSKKGRSAKQAITRTNTSAYFASSKTQTNSKGWQSGVTSPVHSSSSIQRIPHSQKKGSQGQDFLLDPLALISKVQNFDVNDQRSRQLFVKSIRQGNFTRFKVRLRLNINPDFYIEQTTPLLTAIEYNQFACVYALLKCKLDMTKIYNIEEPLLKIVQQFLATPKDHPGMEMRAEYLQVIIQMLQQGLRLSDLSVLKRDSDLLHIFSHFHQYQVPAQLSSQKPFSLEKERVNSWKQEGGIDLIPGDSFQRSYLMYAVDEKNVELVEILLQEGAKPNCKGRDDQNPPLIRAAYLGLYSIVKLLLKYKADVNLTGRQYNNVPATALGAAFRKFMEDPQARIDTFLILRALLDAGAAPLTNPQDISAISAHPELYTLFHQPQPPSLLPSPEDLQVEKWKQQGSIDLIPGDADQRTYLMRAAEEGNETFVKALLKAGANPNCKGRIDQNPPLIRAIFEGFHDLAKLLLAHNADVNLAGRQYNNIPATALGTAFRKFMEDPQKRVDTFVILRTLLEAGAAPLTNIEDISVINSLPELRVLFYRFRHPLILSTEEQEVETWKQKGSMDLIPGDSNQRSRLMVAVEKGNELLVRALLKAGANPNCKGRDNQNPPLIRAVFEGFHALVMLLLENGADVTLTGQTYAVEPTTALITAIERYKKQGDNFPTIRALVSAGAPIHTLGLSALATHSDLYKFLFASLSAEEQTVERWKQKGSMDLIPADPHQRTRLMMAAEEGDEVLVKALLKAGANPNCKGRPDQNPPLIRAAFSGFTNIVKLLLRFRADYNLTGRMYNGRQPTTVLWAALERYESHQDSEEILQVLIAAGAKLDASSAKFIQLYPPLKKLL